MKLTPDKNTEKYLFTDYNIIEDIYLLTKEADIEDFFTDNIFLYGNREDGYSEYEEFYLKIRNHYYKVEVVTDTYTTGSEYENWHCNVTSVEYRLIDKPLPLERKKVTIEVEATLHDLAFIYQYLIAKGCKYKVSE